MPMDQLWQSYASGGYAALKDAAPDDAQGHFYLALVAFGHQDMAHAARHAQAALELAPGSLVYREALAYLQRVVKEGKAAVYVTGEAFGAFIRGGGNLPLYTHTSGALRAVYGEYSGASLLDIGVGDGLALLSALTESIRSITLVEPSAAMLAATSKALAERGVQVDAVNCTLQDFVKTETGPWDIAEATYSLQSIPPKERPQMLSWLRANTGRVLMAEFDPPDFEAMYAPDRVRYVVERYEIGLAEYVGDNSLVAQGFLMPVMFGYFDQTVARANYEQPIDSWVRDFQAAGFATVEKRPIFNYWWATSYLIDAR